MNIGLALGSGGARGLAHILILEVFEEMGLQPTIISGCSVGAVIGSAFATGLTAKELREIVDEVVFQKNSKFWEIHRRSDLIKLLDFIDPSLIKPGGIIKGDKFINFINDKLKVENFEDLKIPMKIVATDYWNKDQVILESGKLLPAIKASYSIPGLFMPVRLNKRLLIDGGMVNPLPYDIIQKETDITVAIDVTAPKSKMEDMIPSAHELLFSTYQIMQKSIIAGKLKFSKPDILIRTNINGIRVHDFMKAELIYKQATPCKDKLKRKLDSILSKVET
ncbi:NTE family protein RssA [bacterium BMS3Abin04]|nr:NTE family protein RssA [bacterium BMS3Abin04]